MRGTQEACRLSASCPLLEVPADHLLYICPSIPRFNHLQRHPQSSEGMQPLLALIRLMVHWECQECQGWTS